MKCLMFLLTKQIAVFFNICCVEIKLNYPKNPLALCTSFFANDVLGIVVVVVCRWNHWMCFFLCTKMSHMYNGVNKCRYGRNVSFNDFTSPNPPPPRLLRLPNETKCFCYFITLTFYYFLFLFSQTLNVLCFIFLYIFASMKMFFMFCCCCCLVCWLVITNIFFFVLYFFYTFPFWWQHKNSFELVQI